MQALFKETKSLQKLLRAVANTNKLVNLIATPAGVSIQAIADSKTTLLQVTAGGSFFAHYQCQESYMLGISAPTLETLVKTAKNDDRVGFSYDGRGNILLVRIGAPSGGATTEYQVRLINIEEEHMEIPAVEHDVVVDVDTHTFHDWKTKTGLANGPVTFAFEPQHVRVSATSDEWGTVQVSHPVHYNTFKEKRSMTINSSSMVALNILATCAKSMRFGVLEDMPLSAAVQMDETTRLALYIAPMMEDD